MMYPELLDLFKTSSSGSMATSRPSLVSFAFHTSPIPPTPIWAVTSYGPRRVPGVSAKSLNYMGQRDCERDRSSKTG